MKRVLDLSLDVVVNETPTPRFVKLILFQAVHDGATKVAFQIGSPSSRVSEAEASEGLMITDSLAGMTPPLEIPRKPDSEEFLCSYLCPGGAVQMPAAPAYLYAPAMRCLLNYTGHSFWNRGPVRRMCRPACGSD